MCSRCMVESTGIRSGKGSAFLSKLMGFRACKHSKDCLCDKCRNYRENNKYADYGFFISDRPVVNNN